MIRSLFLFLIISLSLSCKTKAPITSNNPSMQEKPVSQESQNGFTPDGALFYQNLVYKNPEEIKSVMAETGIDNRMMLSRATKNKVEQDSLRYFEIGHYRSMESGENTFAFVIAWKKIGEQWLKELEVLHPTMNRPMVNRFLIEMARTDWVKYSNLHQPDELVKKIYSEDAVYLNQGKVFKGTAAISEKYQYMKNPDWKIELTPKEVLLVDTSMVFEVGQYQSNGIGHYLLIWEKETRGPWKTILDFNF